MTYEELKAKVSVGIPVNSEKTDEAILSYLRGHIEIYGSKEYIKLLTDVDKTIHTSAKDLFDALSSAGFPQEKITIQDEHRAQIVLGSKICTITDSQNGHTFLYDNNNTRHFLDFIHTPAEIVAAYLVERYCSDNWLEKESQRRLELYKEHEKWEQKRSQYISKYYSVRNSIRQAIYNSKAYDHFHDDFFKTGMKYYKHVNSELPIGYLKAKIEKDWEDIVDQSKEELKRDKRNEAARKRYETVTKPKMNLKKQEVIKQKQALLHEYKEKYGIECKFIYVHSPYDPHHRFVVPASEGQVVSFFSPDGFNREFYDKAMQLVELLNELTATYGKSKVQKKGSLPKEGKQKLQKLLDKIGIARQWQGIYTESQRHYLDNRYKNEVPLEHT